MKYTNPIIPGFAPDPSLVLVDDTFYLVTSSFHLFPGLPIYASKDLQSWTRASKILPHPPSPVMPNSSQAMLFLDHLSSLFQEQRLGRFLT